MTPSNPQAAAQALALRALLRDRLAEAAATGQPLAIEDGRLAEKLRRAGHPVRHDPRKPQIGD